MPAMPTQFPDSASLAPAVASGLAPGFAAMSARRLYIFGGIVLIAAGLLFGDIFAVFVLHQNAARQGEALMAAARAVAAGNAAAVNEIFNNLGNMLEDRGTKVDAHVHMIGAGYLALLLALVQPYIALTQQAKKIVGGAVRHRRNSFADWNFSNSLHRARGQSFCSNRLGERAGRFRGRVADFRSHRGGVGVRKIPSQPRAQRAGTA